MKIFGYCFKQYMLMKYIFGFLIYIFKKSDLRKYIEFAILQQRSYFESIYMKHSKGHFPTNSSLKKKSKSFQPFSGRCATIPHTRHPVTVVFTSGIKKVFYVAKKVVNSSSKLNPVIYNGHSNYLSFLNFLRRIPSWGRSFLSRIMLSR